MVGVVVGTVGRPHGLRGEVAVHPRTDDPAGRFAPGVVLGTDPEAGPLTVASVRWHGGRPLVTFEGVPDRTAAEALRGTLLLADPTDRAPLESADEFYDQDLVGLRALTQDGVALGEITDVRHLPGQDVLAVSTPEGREVLVPFVAAIVPVVDLAGGRVLLDPPPGLFDLDKAE